MKKGKEFVFPENVDKEYGIWKGYTLRDFGYVGFGLLLWVIPPYGPIIMTIKLFVVILAVTIVMALLTLRPVSGRRNIKIRQWFNTQQRYARSQKLYFLAPKKQGGRHEINKR